MAYRLGPEVVDYLLLGPPNQRRQLQDFPILGDVWSRFAERPGEAHDLLLLPSRDKSAAMVAAFVSRWGEQEDDAQGGRSVAYLQNLVVTSLRLEHLAQAVIPATLWWDSIQTGWAGKPPRSKELSSWIQFEFDRLLGVGAQGVASKGATKRAPSSPPKTTTDRLAARLGLLIGTFIAAEKARGAVADVIATLADAKDRLGALNIVRQGTRALSMVIDEHAKQAARAGGAGRNGIIFQATMNREAELALVDSVPAIKADAARSLFAISCKDVAWAVIDSGIDQDHPAFIDRARTAPANGPRPNRIEGTFDFRRIRRILGIRPGDVRSFASDLSTTIALKPIEIANILQGLIKDRDDGLAVDWRKVKPLVTMDTTNPAAIRPESPHGTHVAGIIGADRRNDDDSIDYQGVCPDIRLYDFRVLGSELGDSEFAVSAALQFIRYLNEETGYPRIHGVNMSLSIRHNVRNYACGRTPVCLDAEGLISNGVVVVAAAGNRGYQRFQLAGSETFESYAASSITDPGNADGVITVGSTHRQWPHTFGVSFFSSRGPTGDGRLKPDLLAPGEKVRSCVPGDGEDQMDGTSMAAPHVSGAAALLMARHRELKGQPARVKQILCASATDLKRERSFQGHGMVDVLRAIQSI